jgi:acetyltransferase-like isoleucine patch superfamily enzyme
MTTNIIFGEECQIEKDVIIGYDKLSKLRKGFEDKDRTTIIGNNVRIRSGSVIYAGCIIGDDSHIGHNTIIREFSTVGRNSSLGSGVVCEGYSHVGDYSTIHSQTHLTARMSIGDYVFIGPNVTTMNDRKIRYYRPDIKDSEDIGPIIGDGVAIGGGAIILPQVQIDMGCLIAAGSIVTKRYTRFGVYMGSPAIRVRDVKPEEVVDYLKPFYNQWLIEQPIRAHG